jgi:hypothetical protein
LIVHHVVFAIPQELDDKGKAKAAPLSWKLTASQLAYISKTAQSEAADEAVKNAIGWVGMAETATPSPEVCTVANAPEH